MSVTAVPGSGVHESVRVSPLASQPEPLRLTLVTSATVRSVPAFAVGAVLPPPLLPPLLQAARASMAMARSATRARGSKTGQLVGYAIMRCCIVT